MTCDGCNREAEIRIIVEGSNYCWQCRQKWIDEEAFASDPPINEAVEPDA